MSLYYQTINCCLTLCCTVIEKLENIFIDLRKGWQYTAAGNVGRADYIS